MARRQSELEQVATDIRKTGGEAFVHPIDLADSKSVHRSAEHIIESIGLPDVIINNAGSGRWLYVDETPDEEVLQLIQIPYLAAFYVTKAFLPSLLQRNSGHIINVTSPSAYVAWQGATGYTAARWALRGFSEALAADMLGTRIKVSLMVPGETTSDYFVANPGSKERIPTLARIIPRLTPEQVAEKMVVAVERAPREMIFPFMLWLLAGFSRLTPRLLSWIVTSSGYRRPSTTFD
jgi:short-subunit dehydrogenase